MMEEGMCYTKDNMINNSVMGRNKHRKSWIEVQPQENITVGGDRPLNPH